MYLDVSPEPAFATFHPPADRPGTDTAVVLCPPFGWDEVCSYRSLRAWAQRLADAGYPTLRVSFPGTGDSAGDPRGPERLAVWCATLRCAAQWLRDAHGSRRIASVGLGLGGLIAYRACAEGATIDDLVLWGTPARGRAIVRQLRVFSNLEVSQFYEGLQPPPPPASGELEAGGFLLSAQTVTQLEGVDLDALELPGDRPRRVLLIARDGLAVDARLREHLEGSAVDLTVATGAGYAAMTSHPQQARPALATLERIQTWLDKESRARLVEATQAAPPPRAGAANVAGATDRLTIADGPVVVETPVWIEQRFGRLAAVLTEPANGATHELCAVLLNAGAVRRIGPSRMWVQTARRWAARGVPTVRLDVEGIGDADGDDAPYADDRSLYADGLIPQVLAALDFAQERGLGRRFVLLGLCAGAYWAFHAALDDARVVAALMVNPRVLVWDPGLAPARDLRALISQPLSLSKIYREASFKRVRMMGRWLLAAPRQSISSRRSRRPDRVSAVSEVDAVLDRLRGAQSRALLLFSEHEPLRDELERSGRMAMLRQWPNVTVEHVAVRDHTLRPSSAQRHVHQILDRALDRELALAPRREPANGRA
jgi:pimeloyl-ACP methyl ester carboxylesterase